MFEALQYEKTSTRTYRHYTLPPAVSIGSGKKLEFFYVGRKANVIDELIRNFESGYASENTVQAVGLLQRLTSHSHPVPDVIIMEAALGKSTIQTFRQFLSGQEKFRAVPVFVEGSSLSQKEIADFGNDPVADDIISLTGLDKERLQAKVRFWKRVKERSCTTESQVDLGFSPVIKSAAAKFSKRAFDVVVSALLMIILSPLILLIMLALRIESKGPAFYISKRAGRGYKIFNFYKFRTMVVQANEKMSDLSHLNLYNPLQPNGPVFVKINNDPRITRLGAFLRKCSLDELPQLLNVFKGDMSLVGNRPLPLYEAASLTTDEWATRFLAPAGMTGLWQIKKKTKYEMTAEERLMLDINYAENSSFLFDLWIMANTPSAVIQRTNV